MTRKALKRIILKVAIGYLIVIILAIFLRFFDTTEKQIIYGTLKDLIPLIFAIPLGYLGFCFNSRRAFVETKKKLWNLLVDVINDAIHSTYKNELKEDEFREVLKNLAKSIDQIRATYKNVDRKAGSIGYYPFEPIKQIYKDYEAMGFGLIDNKISEQTRHSIIVNWKSIRDEFLYEFERFEPEKPVL